MSQHSVEAERIEIEICLGSSCFARGNFENLAVLRDFERAAGRDVVSLTGCRCREQCRNSPNLKIDGKTMQGLKVDQLRALLKTLDARSTAAHGAGHGAGHGAA